mmetsp:Transcript_12410/g.32674  ORF Transcript_12410/g.32674 Transcript_12410/m.32674 type:complete len:197 (-) Transcript_12410:922-1512(-)
MILALCTSALAFAPPRRGPCLGPLAYGRRGDAAHDRWRSTADALATWRGDEATVAKFWRIDCDDDGFTWERRWPRRKPVVEHVAWDRITRVCWECGEWLCMDNFYLIADDEDSEWVVPSGALDHGRLVDALDRKGLFSNKTYINCQCVSDGGFTICEANPNAKAPAPSTNLSYVDRLHATEQAPCRIIRRSKLKQN